MPRVPTYDGAQVRSAPLQGGMRDYVRSDAAFGGEQARQLGEMGKAGMQLGGVLREQEERRAYRDDQAKADAAFVALQEEYSQQSMNWKTNRRLSKADGLAEDADKWWGEAEQRYTKDLSDRQRGMLQQHASRYRLQGMNDIRGFQENQRVEFAVQAGTAYIGGQIKEAAGNPTLAGASRVNIQKKVNELRTFAGWDDNMAQEQISKYTTVMHQEVVKTLIAAGKPDEAKRYFDQAKGLGDFDPTKANDIEQGITKAANQKKAEDLASSLTGKPLEEGLAAIANEKDPEVRKAARQQFMLDKKDEEVIAASRERAASDKVWQAIANGRKPVQADLDAMNGRERIQVNDYYAAKAKAAADKTGKLHAKEDNYDALDMAEEAIKRGDITDPKQLERFAPFLRGETYRTLRKSLEKRADVPRGEVEKVFLDRLGKSKAKMGEGERKQWVAFQDYINENVRETKRPEDLEAWADRWFMSGYGKNDSMFRNDPDTFGQARTAGRKDFVISTPETAQADVDQSIAVLRQAGVKAPGGKAARDEFYTNHYLDAARWFGARNEKLSPARAAAYSVLKQNNKPITPANINAVIEQMKGVPRAEPGKSP